MNSDKNSQADAKAALGRAVESGEAIAFVGSGPSQVCCYPSWRELLDRLCSACGVDRLRQEAPPREYLTRADECLRSDSCAFHSTVQNLFAERPHDSIVYTDLLRAPFKAWITTNFDIVLARHAVRQRRELYAYPELPPSAIWERPVFYLHGIASAKYGHDPRRIVLTKSQFDQAYARDSGRASTLLAAMAPYHSLIFIGCRLGEPQIDCLFRKVHGAGMDFADKGRSKMPEHYALLEKEFRDEPDGTQKRDGVTENLQDRQFANRGISVVRYDPEDDYHSGLIPLFEKWSRLPTREVSDPFGPADLPGGHTP